MQISRKSPHKSAGFTLVELLVSMVVTLIIVGILVFITQVALDHVKRSRAEVRTARQAKIFVEKISSDLECLVFKAGSSIDWMAAQYIDAPDPVIGTADIQTPNPSKFVFLTAPVDRYPGDLAAPASKGDVSCVSYSLSYTDPISPPATADQSKFKTFACYRSLTNPQKVFDSVIVDPTNPPQSNLINSLEKQVSPANQKVSANFVCENIFQYTLTFHIMPAKTADNPTPKVVRVTLGEGDKPLQIKELHLRGTGLEILPDSAPTSVNDQARKDLRAGKVEAVEVSVTVISDYGIEQMKSRPFTTPQQIQTFLAKNSYQYSRLVKLAGR